MAWKFTYQNETYRAYDLTWDELEQIEAKIDGMNALAVHRELKSFRKARILVATVVALRTGRPYDEVWTEVGKSVDYRAFLSLFEPDGDDLPTEFTDGFPPKEGAAQTSGSSGALSDSDGLPT